MDKDTYPTAIDTSYLSQIARIKRWFKRLVLVCLALLLATGGWLGWHIYSDAAKATGDKNPLQLLSIFKPVSLNQTDGRTNILLSGYSIDDPGHQGAELTDSIMVLSIDKTTNSAVMISVPRDLWVNVPDQGYEKINAAYEQGGMTKLEEVLDNDLGININYYALIDYTAVRDAVNAVGGVTIDVSSDDPRGIYDPNTGIKLPNGEVGLSGNQALALTRSRGDGAGSYGFPDGDFDRIKYQQEILLALKAKVDSASVITNPFKIASLSSSIGDNLKTNMKTDDIETVYSITKKISSSNIKTVTLNQINGQTLLSGYTSYDGEDALIPSAGIGDYTDIQAAIQQLLS
jgi:LCP family protein required for cell wall assembly